MVHALKKFKGYFNPCQLGFPTCTIVGHRKLLLSYTCRINWLQVPLIVKAQMQTALMCTFPDRLVAIHVTSIDHIVTDQIGEIITIR